MKNVLTIFLFFLAMSIQAQETAFFKAMQTNDYVDVLAQMDNNVEVSIIENQDLYSKRNAIQKIQNWVKEKNIKILNEVHTGESNDKKSHYKVAKLRTSEGQYRVFVYVQKKRNSHLIKKIQIDKF